MAWSLFWKTINRFILLSRLKYVELYLKKVRKMRLRHQSRPYWSFEVLKYCGVSHVTAIARRLYFGRGCQF